MNDASREHQADCLRARFPRWHVWYVPSAVTRRATWHAQPARFPLDAAARRGAGRRDRGRRGRRRALTGSGEVNHQSPQAPARCGTEHNPR